MPRRYNLRKRDPSVKWIEDDTLKVTEESETEDEDFTPPTEEEVEDSEEEDDEDLPKSGLLGYLMNKYVPSHRMKKGGKKEKEDEAPALDLNEDETDYFEELPKSKQKKLNKQMKQLSALVKDGDVPYKFRILELPITDALKATVIKKLDLLDRMGDEGGENHKLRSWVDGFLRVPFGTHVPLPVKLDDGPKPCSDFLAQTRKTLDGAV